MRRSAAGYNKHADDARNVQRGGVAFFIGKPTANLSTGILSGKFVQPYKGPAYSSDAAVGSPRPVHFATGDYTTSDYVVVTYYLGKGYVSCLPTS
jgi:hypothetical protein